MATSVTNIQIVEALRFLGLPVPGDFNTSGNQHGAFMVRVANIPGFRPGMFEQAEGMAGNLAREQLDPQGNQPELAIQALRNRGVSEEAIRQIVDNAANLQSTQRLPGLTRKVGDKNLTLTAVMQSAGQILGPDSLAVTSTVGKLRGSRFDERALALPPVQVTRGLTIEAPSPEERAAQRGRGVPAAPAPPPPAGAAPSGGKAQVGAGAQASVADQIAAGISAGVRAAMPKPATPAEIRAQLNGMYGWAAGLADIPEVAKILDDAAMGIISKEEVGNRFKNTHYYKTTTQAGRDWKVLERTAPAEASMARDSRRAEILGLAQKIGITMDPGRLDQLVNLSLTYGWEDVQINTFLANEIDYDPTQAKTGVLGSLKEAQRQYLVPLSDQAMSAWASAIVTGTKSAAEFDQYLRDSASSLFPALGEALKDPEMTTRKYLDPYGQVIAKTLGTNPEDIDWMDPKYMRFISQVDDKNNRTVMSLADVQRTVMSDDQYGYDETTQGQHQKMALATGLAKTWGLAI